MFGYPYGELDYYGGTISRFMEDNIILDDIIPQYGNSGRPILYNETNEVLGIVLDASKKDNIDQYALKIDIVKELIFHTDIVNKSIINPDDNLAKGGSNYSELFYLDYK